MPLLGLVSDPDFPSDIAESLAGSLPERLGESFNGDEWTVEVVSDPVAAGRSSGKEILDATERQRELHGWDYAVGVTDLPLRRARNPVLADIGAEHERVAVISLPALGGFQPQRRARQLLVNVLGELTDSGDRSGSGLYSGPTELLAPIRRERADSESIAVRYRSTKRRGRARLLSGMVRSNTPWRLVLGMSGALAAALATSVFALTSSTVWQIADMLGPWRQILVVVLAVALMATWLIVTHNLWEKPEYTADREQRLLYNSSTAITIVTGVSCLYVVLFVINLAGGLFLIDPELLSSKLGGGIGFGNYLGLAWAATSMGVAAGALGSGLEDDATVRRAAYGYREAQRRANQQRAERADEADGDSGGER
ncbi:hypothetical protein SAMN04487905_101233 [Actinopolyspora xinjiangensis]|uniref:5,10-methylene-tetrahydrofolate dehydrogenase/Methenyl tetrahydrofolate cyclohydrolase n=1 Tax=Actinopolyspora xinjiangensis TaxID=405564 RepID=A0A1H0NRX9_9ACTN|nr:hypothetical protein [Actinopolyspora xinjiangensis]SDO95419.1 hypothetical protein SAMN04487905_101233 [Actinopolyspora xinjiangensis]